jgi:hypothetical protein
VCLEDIGEFVAWLRLPTAGRDGAVAVLPSVPAAGEFGDDQPGSCRRWPRSTSISSGMEWTSESC